MTTEEEELTIDSEVTTEARASEEQLTGTAVDMEAITEEEPRATAIDSEATTLEELRAT